jgi:hypothetical protein
MFTNDTPLTLIRVENGQRNGYWDENEPWKFPPTRINPLDNFRLPLREKGQFR